MGRQHGQPTSVGEQDASRSAPQPWQAQPASHTHAWLSRCSDSTRASCTCLVEGCWEGQSWGARQRANELRRRHRAAVICVAPPGPCGSPRLTVLSAMAAGRGVGRLGGEVVAGVSADRACWASWAAPAPPVRCWMQVERCKLLIGALHTSALCGAALLRSDRQPSLAPLAVGPSLPPAALRLACPSQQQPWPPPAQPRCSALPLSARPALPAPPGSALPPPWRRPRTSAAPPPWRPAAWVPCAPGRPCRPPRAPTALGCPSTCAVSATGPQLGAMAAPGSRLGSAPPRRRLRPPPLAALVPPPPCCPRRQEGLHRRRRR